MMRGEQVSSKARRILGPGSLYSPDCKGWFWLKNDGSKVYLGFMLNEIGQELDELEWQINPDKLDVRQRQRE